jgi:hypothetical protein
MVGYLTALRGATMYELQIGRFIMQLLRPRFMRCGNWQWLRISWERAANADLSDGVAPFAPRTGSAAVESPQKPNKTSQK